MKKVLFLIIFICVSSVSWASKTTQEMKKANALFKKGDYRQSVDYYQKALERLELIFDSKKGSPEGDELEILGVLIEKYEDEHFPIGFPDPIEAILKAQIQKF